MSQSRLMTAVALVAILTWGGGSAASAQTPDYEITYWNGWGDHLGVPTLSLFGQVLVSDYNHENAIVYETSFATGFDRCWFPTSRFAPSNVVTGSSWIVGFDNSWGWDAVGWLPEAVDYYRYERVLRRLPMPCGTTVYQRMWIDDFAGSRPYQNNLLRGDIGPEYVCSERDGVGNCRPW